MNRAILGEGGTVMQFVGDAVMAVFGAPFAQADHADRAVAAASAMHAAAAEINARWATEGLPAFGLGLGLSTGEAAAALLGSEERLEYTLVGDTVNLTQRLQQLAAAGRDRAVGGDAAGAAAPVETVPLAAQIVKGRDTPVVAYKIGSTRAAAEPVPARTRPTDGAEGAPATHRDDDTETAGLLNDARPTGRPRRAQDLRGRERTGARPARRRPRRWRRESSSP